MAKFKMALSLSRLNTTFKSKLVMQVRGVSRQLMLINSYRLISAEGQLSPK